MPHETLGPGGSFVGMTLNLVIATPSGLWLSTDFAVTDYFRGKSTPRQDHWSTKYFEAITNNRERLAVTYTGVAEVVAVEPDFGVPEAVLKDLPGMNKTPGKKRTVAVSEWLSWILWGKGRTLNEIVHHIVAEASKMPEFRRNVHMFTGVAVAASDGAWVIQISNADVRDGDVGAGGKVAPRVFGRRPLGHFEVMGRHVQTSSDAAAGALGLGAQAISEEDFKLLHTLARRKPKDHRDYMNVLAAINKRAASRDRHRSVSPACEVLYLDPVAAMAGEEVHFASHLYENGQKVPKTFEGGVFPVNLFGIDILSFSRAAFSTFLKSREAHFEEKAQEYIEDGSYGSPRG